MNRLIQFAITNSRMVRIAGVSAALLCLCSLNAEEATCFMPVASSTSVPQEINSFGETTPSDITVAENEQSVDCIPQPVEGELSEMELSDAELSEGEVFECSEVCLEVSSPMEIPASDIEQAAWSVQDQSGVMSSAKACGAAVSRSFSKCDHFCRETVVLFPVGPALGVTGIVLDSGIQATGAVMSTGLGIASGICNCLFTLPQYIL